MIKLENSPIAYRVSRCGPEKDWVCFLHAAYVDHRMYRTQAEAFEGRYNLLLVDILGHGQSCEIRKGDKLIMMAGWLRDILDTEGIQKAHFVGISMGAVIAQDFANHFPDRVKSLACFGGYDINNFDVTMQKGNTAAQIRMMLKAPISIRWFAEDVKKISAYTESAQQEFFEMNLHFQKRSFMYLAELNAMVNKFPPSPRSYPLLIGCGEHDIPMEHQAVELWKANKPACQVVVFENAGHCVNMDVPQRFNEVMDKFWTENPSV